MFQAGLVLLRIRISDSPSVGWGTGVIVTLQGHIVTNAHLLHFEMKKDCKIEARITLPGKLLLQQPI